MSTTSVTLTQTQTYTLTTTQVDASGNPVTTPDPTYNTLGYVSSNPSVATVSAFVPNQVIPTGVIGSTVITATETSTDTKRPALTGTLNVTVVGTPPASLLVSGTIVGT
jgi:hypothetical protein